MNSRVVNGLLLMLIGVVGFSTAQYLEPREFTPLQGRYIALGVASHEYLPRATNSAADSLQIAFNRWAPTLNFHQGAIDVLFAYTRYQLRGTTHTAIHLGTVVSMELPLIGPRSGGLKLPLCIAGDYTKTESDGTERDNFNVGSLGIGTGLAYRYTGRDLEVAVQALGIAHYAFEGYGTGNGSSMVLTADAHVLWRTPILFDGLVFGYRLRSQTWSLGSDRFDYRAVMHGPYVGALF